MNHPSLSVVPHPVLEARLLRLERENRRFKLAAGLSTLLLFTWTACSVAPQAKSTVSAERFVLTNPDGSEAGHLGFDEGGNPILHLVKGHATAALSLVGPGLVLRGPDGKTTAYMGVDSRNTSRIELTSERLMDGVRLTAKPDGSSGVYVLDSTGRERGSFEALSIGGANLLFRDGNGKVRTQLGVDPENAPSLILLDERGVRRLGTVIQTDGNAVLELQDLQARPRLQLTTQFDGSPRLEMLREDGAASFTAP